MTWPVKIRVYPEGRALFATVYVWPTKRAMREYAREHWDLRDRVGAYCAQVWRMKVFKDGRTRKRPEFAEVHFSLNQVDMETVTHEFTHAAWCWARRVGWKPDYQALNDDALIGKKGEKSTEERFAHVLGQMADQFHGRMRERKLV